MIVRRLIAAVLFCALCACGFPAKTVLGKLGQVTESTEILSKPDSGARVYYSVKEFEYVVVKPLSKTWTKVLLQNGSYGYIKADLVALLPYEVTAERPTTRSMPLASRGGGPSAIAAQQALRYIGTPYVWGGNDPRRGVDCSGLVQQMFGTIGQRLPRTAAEQVNVGRPVTRLEDLKQGDRLYFWDSKRGKVGHTGIYLGNGYFVHSSRTHNGVATDYLGSKKWLNMLVAARRS